MRINQNILATLRTFFTKQTSAVATTEFLNKTANRKKISNEDFNLFEGEISLDVS